MKAKLLSTQNIRIFLGGIIAISIGVSEIYAQTYFDATVSGDATPTDFETLISFSTPTGTGANRKTVTRIVTPTPAAFTDLAFEITPPSGKKTALLELNASGVASDFVVVTTTGEIVANPVIAEVISDPPDNAPVASGFTIIRLTIVYDPNFGFSTGETWHLKAKEQTTDRRYVGFIATDVDDPTTTVNEVDVLATQPRIIVKPSPLNFGEVLLNPPANRAPRRTLSVVNEGTGVLQITSVPEPGSPFQRAPVSTPFNINPMSELNIEITFSPTSTGNVNRSLVIASNDPASPNKTATLEGIGVRLDLIALLDVSCSMNWRPDGTGTTEETQKRLYLAKQALDQLYRIVSDLRQESRFGLYLFPDPTTRNWRDCPTSGPSKLRRIPINTIGPVTDSQIGLALGSETTTDGLNAFNCYATPMADGIGIAHPDLRKGQFDKRAIFLFSDGMHICNSSSFPNTPRDWIPTLKDDRIPTYTVPYGKIGASNVDHSLLSDLATETEALMFDANVDDPDAIKKAFGKALASYLGLQIIEGPDPTITRNQSRSHAVCISRTDYSVVFIVDWNVSRTRAIDFTLESPTGAVITPSSASADVSYYENQTYAMYVVRGGLLQDGAGAGEWRLKLQGSSDLSQGQVVNYSYRVFTESEIDISANLSDLASVTGQGVLLEASVHRNGLAVNNMPVYLEFSAPTQSFGTYLATTEVDCTLIYKAPDQIFGEPATLVNRKLFALQNFLDKPFQANTCLQQLQLYDDGTHGDRVVGDGTYSNWVPAAAIDGTYNYRISTDGLFSGVDCIKRELFVSRYVNVQMTAESIFNETVFDDFEITPYFPRELIDSLRVSPPEGYVRSNVVFTAKDSLGNFWGPGHDDEIQIGVENGRFIGPVVDNLDGSYIRVLEYRKGDRPAVSVKARDVASQPKPLPRPPKDDLPNPKYIMPFAGWFDFDSALPFEDNLVFGIRIGYGLSRNIYLEGEFGATPTDELNEGSGSLFFASANLLIDIVGNSSSKIKPFFVGGVGAMNFLNTPGIDESLAIIAGAGIKIRLSGNLWARIESRDYIAFPSISDGSSTHNFLHNAVLMIPF